MENRPHKYKNELKLVLGTYLERQFILLSILFIYWSKKFESIFHMDDVRYIYTQISPYCIIVYMCINNKCDINSCDSKSIDVDIYFILCRVIYKE